MPSKHEAHTALQFHLLIADLGSQLFADEVRVASYFCNIYTEFCGPGSLVGIATGYGLHGPGIESRCGDDIFRTCPDRPWGPPVLLYNGYRVFPGGKERLRRDADPSPPSKCRGQERVELYLYSPYGPYGLYRASVPVQGCALPLPLYQIL